MRVSEGTGRGDGRAEQGRDAGGAKATQVSPALSSSTGPARCCWGRRDGRHRIYRGQLPGPQGLRDEFETLQGSGHCQAWDPEPPRLAAVPCVMPVSCFRALPVGRGLGWPCCLLAARKKLLLFLLVLLPVGIHGCPSVPQTFQPVLGRQLPCPAQVGGNCPSAAGQTTTSRPSTDCRAAEGLPRARASFWLCNQGSGPPSPICLSLPLLAAP